MPAWKISTPGNRARRLQAANLGVLGVVARIALRGHDDGERGVVVPAQVEGVEHAVGGGDQRRQQVGLEAHHEHLALGVAEAHVVLVELGAVLGDHDAEVEHALEGRPPRRHAAHGGPDDLVERPARHLGRHHRRRRIGAHAAGIGARVAVADALVVLRRGQRQHVLAVDQGEEARLLAFQELLDDDLGARGSERAGEAGVDGLLGRRRRLGDDHALAGRQAVGLDDDRQLLRRQIGLGGARIGEAAIGAGGNGELAAQVLGEALRALELRRRLGWAKYLDPGGRQVVDEAGHQRRLGPHHDEADPVVGAEPDDGGVVGHVERHAAGDLGNAGVARRAIELGQQRARRQGPGQRVLTAAGTDEENVHQRRSRKSSGKSLQSWPRVRHPHVSSKRC